MALTSQQKLYTLPDYYLLLMLGDNEVCGILSMENAQKIDKDKLYNCGFYLKKITLSDLYSQALDIIYSEKLI